MPEPEEVAAGFAPEVKRLALPENREQWTREHWVGFTRAQERASQRAFGEGGCEMVTVDMSGAVTKTTSEEIDLVLARIRQ